MKTTKLMPKVITEILTAHGKSIDDADLHLRLEMPSYMPLVIERIDVNRISVAHYYEQNGDLIADPDMTFYIYNGFWIVSEIQEPWGYRMCSEQTFTGWKYNPTALKDVTAFANQWARNLREQGWATRATKGE
jgi:hypothetical protein